jgi:SAM-dependent methyltransferase
LCPYGFESSDKLFLSELTQQFTEGHRVPRFCSLGSGNGDLEIKLARELVAAGRQEFTFDCIDLNTEMRERALAAADDAGIAEHLRFIASDLNSWTPAQEYDAVIANQSLHHIVNLEGLFAEVKKALRPQGVFLISDMIGRNGHLRWPEAMSIIQEFWKTLPSSFRVNRVTSRYEHEFEDWDCSVEGFEGVRAQDILPLLIDQFQFRLFAPFGNLIDPFIDRSFGPNFDPARFSDRAFIDAVHHRDEQELAAGRLKPTHLIAVLGTVGSEPVCVNGLTPAYCVRHPDILPPTQIPSEQEANPRSFFGTFTISEEFAAELDRLTIILRDFTASVEARIREAGDLAEWARSLESRLTKASQLLEKRQIELDDRTQWALSLDARLAEAYRLLEKQEGELIGRTRWARQLEREWEEKTAWAETLKKERIQLELRTAHLERQLAYVRRPWTALAPFLRRFLMRSPSTSRDWNAQTPRSSGTTGK